MLSESLIGATVGTSTKSNVSSTLKDIGIVSYEIQPQNTLRHGFKKSSSRANCVAISTTHIFAAQADRAVIHVYNREKGNQESTVAFPERIHSLAFIGESSGFVVIGTEGGSLTLWDVASGRQTTSTASHLQAVSCLSVLPGSNFILSGSSDSTVHLWSLSQLVSFSQPQSLSLNDLPSNAPLRTFSNHRLGITALTCGHSRYFSNFVISASSDGTCYIWSASDCQVLRTILLPSAPQCLAIDPADRAMYSGHEDGSIHSVNFYHGSQNVRPTEAMHPQQLHAKDSWSPASPQTGSAQCLTLSYDGTTLLSGHSSGRIVAWDTAKHRIQKIIADLGRSVTNIGMQPPEGLPSKRPRIEIKTVVKPKVGASSLDQVGTSGVPGDYTLQVQINPLEHSSLLTPGNKVDFPSILAHPTFPKHLIDEAVLDLTFPFQPTTKYDIGLSPDPSSSSPAQISKLESRISDLEENLSIYVSAAERSRARRLARLERREQYGEKKRQAYINAVKKGEDGDLAIQGWEEKERDVDMESDEVELGEEVYADV